MSDMPSNGHSWFCGHCLELDGVTYEDDVGKTMAEEYSDSDQDERLDYGQDILVEKLSVPTIVGSGDLLSAKVVRAIEKYEELAGDLPVLTMGEFGWSSEANIEVNNGGWTYFKRTPLWDLGQPTDELFRKIRSNNPPRMTATQRRELNYRPREPGLYKFIYGLLPAQEVPSARARSPWRGIQDVEAWGEPLDKPTMSSAHSLGGIMLSGMIRAVAIIASGGSSLIISGYYDALTTGRWRLIDARNAHAPFALEGFMIDSDGFLDSGSASLILRPLEEILKAFYKHWPDPTSYLHRLIYNPTPIEFLAACCIYWTSISAYYYLHRHHRYQNHFLASGIMLAFMLGWVFDRDWRGALMDFMPLLVYMSLVLSAGVHWVIGIHGRHRAAEVRLVTDEKRGPLLC